MTDRALAAGYKTREDLDKEFERIKARARTWFCFLTYSIHTLRTSIIISLPTFSFSVSRLFLQTVELNSDEAQEVVGRLSPDHWERISLSFVKNRSASDCRSFYRHALAPQPPWSLEESTKLRALATTHNGRNVSVGLAPSLPVLSLEAFSFYIFLVIAIRPTFPPARTKLITCPPTSDAVGASSGSARTSTDSRSVPSALPQVQQAGPRQNPHKLGAGGRRPAEIVSRALGHTLGGK